MAMDKKPTLNLTLADDDPLWQKALATFAAEARPQGGHIFKKHLDEEIQFFDAFINDRRSVADARKQCVVMADSATASYSSRAIKLGGKNGITIWPKDAFKSILRNIDIFIKIGDTATKGGAETVSLAWSGIRMILIAFQSDEQHTELWCNACLSITSTLVAARTYSKIYNSGALTDAAQDLVGKIGSVYKTILYFTYAANIQLSRTKIRRLVDQFSFSSSAGNASAGALDGLRGVEKSMRDASMVAFQESSKQTSDSLLTGQVQVQNQLGSLEGLFKEYVDSNSAWIKSIDQGLQLVTEMTLQLLQGTTTFELDRRRFKTNMTKLNPTNDAQRLLEGKLETRRITGPQTCTWIFDHSDFKSWSKPGSPGILWVSSGSGHGKSILMASSIDHLQRKAAEEGSIVVYFFASKDGNKDALTKSERIRQQLVSQLYTQTENDQELLQKANEAFDTTKKKKKSSRKTERGNAKGKKTQTQSAEPQSSSNGKPSAESASTSALPDMIDTFETLVTDILQTPCYLVVDALDEVDDPEDFIDSMIDLSEALQGSLKIMLSSRPEDVIRAKLSKYPTIRVEDYNEADIRAVATAKLEAIKTILPSERPQIVDAVVSRASNKFTYVDLAAKFFQKPFQRPLARVIKVLADDNKSMYQQTLRGTDQAYIDLLKHSLTWTLLRKDTISVAEIIEAYTGTYLEDSVSGVDSAETDDDGTAYFIELIQNAGAAFFDITSTGLVKEYHPSVRDSFVDSNAEHASHEKELCDGCQRPREGRQEFMIDSGRGNLEMAITLVKHLNSKLFQRRFFKKYDPTASEDSEDDNADDSKESSSGDNEEDKEGDTNGEPQIAQNEQTENGEGKTDLTSEDGQKTEDAQLPNGDLKTTVDSSDTGIVETSAPNTDDGQNTASPDKAPEAEVLISNGITEEPSGSSNSGAAQADGSSPDQPSDEQGEPSDKAEEKADDPGKETNDSTDSEIGQDETDDFKNEDDIEENIIDQGRPRYEIMYWTHHIKQAEKYAKGKEYDDLWTQLWSELDRFFFPQDPTYNTFQAWLAEFRDEFVHNGRLNGPGVSPWHIGAAFGLTWVCKKLNERKHPQTETKRGWWPINLLPLNQDLTEDVELLKILMEPTKGKDLTSENNPLSMYWWNMFQQDPGPEFVQVLIDEGLDLNGKYQRVNSASPLHAVAYFGTQPAVVDLLAEHKAVINSTDTWLRTPLHYLLDRSKIPPAMLTKFLDLGAEVNAESEWSERPLSGAARYGEVEAGKILIEHKALIEDEDDEGWTALHIAAAFGHAKFCELLLNEKHSPTRVENRNRHAFYLACERGHPETAMVLLEALIKAGCGLDVIDRPVKPLDRTALRKACFKGLTDVVHRMSELDGFSKQLHAVDTLSGRTPAHAAAQAGYRDVLLTLIDAGADLTIKDSTKCTPLHTLCAAWFGSETAPPRFEETAILLIEKNGSVLQYDAELTGSLGEDLVLAAASHGSTKVLELLWSYGFAMDVKDRHGWSALLFAQENKHEAAAQFIQAHNAMIRKRPSSLVPRKKNGGLTVSEDRLEISYKVRDANDSYPAFTSLANHPVPIDSSRFYFEAEILSFDADIEVAIAVGLSTEGCPEQSWLPGHRRRYARAWGFHSDDGAIYDSSSSDGLELRHLGYQDYQRVGAVVGCALDLKTKEVFFTIDGKRLGVAVTKVSGRLYPAVGILGTAAVRANFGSSPFKWNPEKWDVEESDDEVVVKAEEKDQAVDDAEVKVNGSGAGSDRG